MRLLAAILINSTLFCCAAHAATLRGQVYDTSGAVIARATIRVLDASSRSTVQSVHPDQEGRFEVQGLGAGDYLIAVSSPGFTEKLMRVGALRPGDVSFQKVQLEVLDCDAPQVNCDIITTGPYTDPHPLVFHGSLTVNRSEAVDLEKGVVPPSGPDAADFNLTTQNGGLYLTPLNKAAIVEPCKTDARRRKTSGKVDSVRMDGLGLGSEICIRTNRGDFSKIFVQQLIEPGSDQIVLQVVTRAK